MNFPTRLARSTGARYEQTALLYLKKKGLTLLQQNFHCRHGEIDLIMRHKGCLTFIEVRYRTKNRFSTALESVDRRKQSKIVTTAAIYLSRNQEYANDTVRFDVVAIDDTSNGESRIEWVQDAFRP